MRTTILNRLFRSASGKLLMLACIASLNAVVTHAALVTTCTAGKYLKLNEQNYFDREGLCIVCDKGYECPSETPTILNPRKCNNGYYSGFGAAICIECPAGWACSAPDALPVPCPSNSYSHKGSTACLQCPSGTVCKEGILVACTAGQICDNSDVYPEPLKCPAGKSCDGKSTTNCASGWYSVEGSSACTPCPMGKRCIDAAHEPIDCGAGTYQDQEGQTTCEACPALKVCKAVNKPPESCTVGTYGIKGGAACFPCPAGVRCTQAANGDLTYSACTKGEYSLSGMADCARCPAGKECTDFKAVGADCGTGEYSLVGEHYCKPCPAGHRCPNKDREPIGCQAGWYADAGKTACTECSAGSSCEKPDEMPRVCPDGQTSAKGATYCDGCPVGQSCTAGVTTECTEGQIPNQHGSACINCPAGVACPQKKYDTQYPCGPGYYSLDGVPHCLASPAGKYAATTVDAPVDCADGWYSDIAWTTCLRCPPGFACKDKTSRHISLCKPGTYTKLTSTFQVCEDCPAGKMCPIAIPGYRDDETDATQVLVCPDGMFAPARSFDCEVCKPGMECKLDATRATTGTACLPCCYQLGGTKECSTCPKNYECPFGETIKRCPMFFYSVQGERHCQPCPDGQDCQDAQSPPCPNNVCLDPAQTEDPVDCAAGYYSIAHDMTCKPCPKGHYCGAVKTTFPTKCAGGTYADEGQVTCTTCPTEYYSKEGSEYCSPVPPGYKYKADKTTIEVCPHKTYSYWGVTTCETCPDGYLCPQQSGNGYAWQNSCPKGSWCKAGVQTKCVGGKFGTQERGSSVAVCETCPPGYNCLEGTADFEKVPCPKGGYCEAGKTVVACPAGTFNDEQYSRSVADCKTCPIGHSCGTEAAGGTLCAEGYYCPRGIASPGLPCPAGTHGNSQTGKRDINECLPCPPGNYCPEASAKPTKSPVGFYTPLTGMPSLASLYKCPPTFYCPDLGMTTYKGNFCDPGYVCPAGSSSKTQVECPEGTYSDRRDLLDPRHCEMCPKGFSCQTHSTTTNSRIVVCPNNRYCPDGTKAAAIPICPAGTYAPFTTAKSEYDCLPCPAGKYCENLNDSGPVDCPKGHYCPPGTQFVDQFPCPVGKYNDLLAQKSINECLHCGFGNYCPDTGCIAATLCPKGTYNSESTTAGYCTVCEAGYYCAATRVYKEPCPIGFYSERGMDYCYACPIGTYCPNQATSDVQMKDQLCPEGTYCMRKHSWTSNSVTHTNEEVGIDIWPNTLQSGTAGQYACPQFKYCPEGTKKPLDIVRGTMQHLHAAGSLIDALQMTKGEYSKATGTDPPFLTTACEAGYYCPAGSFAPVPCPAGQFRDNTYGHDADSCGKCPAGTYCPATGTHTPTVCPKGRFCPEGAKQAQPCPRGTYNDVTGVYDSRGCKNCQAGHYCPFLGQESTDTTNHKCDAGYYCIEGSQRPEPTDQVTGSRCPNGYYCEQATASAQSCVDGKYGPFEGARAITDCILCKPGYYCLGSGGGEATNQCKAGISCKEGAVQDTTVQAGVTAVVAAGSYVDQGTFFEILCQQGYYNGDPGRGECDKCEAGYFCDRLGTTNVATGDMSKNRQECAKGHYCPKYEFFVTESTASGVPDNSTTASVIDYRQIPCEAGKYNDQTARTGVEHCLACKPEYACEFRGVTGDSDMVKCAAGYFCKSGAATRYPEDTTNQENGPCPPGFWCAEGTENPTACLAGTFNKQWRAWDISFCLECPPGYLCDGTGNTDAVVKIEAGKFGTPAGTNLGITAGVTGCGQTVKGVYCPLASHFELICPMGFYQTNGDRGNCFECPPGSFCMGGQDVKCNQGYYCP